MFRHILTTYQQTEWSQISEIAKKANYIIDGYEPKFYDLNVDLIPNQNDGVSVKFAKIIRFDEYISLVLQGRKKISWL